MPIDILKTIEIAKKIIRLQCDYIYKKNGNKISEKDIKIEVKKELESNTTNNKEHSNNQKEKKKKKNITRHLKIRHIKKSGNIN